MAKTNKESAQFRVRLLDSSGGSPVTPIEKLTVTALKDQGPTPFPALVERVAREIYLDEIRTGAWVLDIGLYGAGLFVRSVTSELKSRDGTLWKIERSETTG